MAIAYHNRDFVPGVTKNVTKQAKTVTADVTHLEQQIVILKARIAELELLFAPIPPKTAAERMREYRKRQKG